MASTEMIKRRLLRCLGAATVAMVARAMPPPARAPAPRRREPSACVPELSLPAAPGAVPGQVSLEQMLCRLDQRNTEWRCDTCAQQCFWALAEPFGLQASDDVAQALVAFGHDVAEAFGACGAVTGCLMALGLALGPRYADVAGTAREFCRRFEEEAGSTGCGRLLEPLARAGVPVADGEPGSDGADARWSAYCLSLMRSACRIAAELIMTAKGADWYPPRRSVGDERFA